MSFGYRILGFGAGGGRPEFMEATGGTVTTSGNDKIHTFNSSGTFTVTTGSDSTDGDKVRYLVVGAGGGSHSSHGAGGGAGGMRTNYPGDPLAAPAALTVADGDITVTVGAGGTGPDGGGNANANKGGDSVFSTITSTGGGGGVSNGPRAGNVGGSGGGAGYFTSGSISTLVGF